MTRVVIIGEIFNADLSVGGGPMPGGGGPVDPGWGHSPGHPANRPPGSWGGPVDPGWGQRPPVDPGYGRPGWSPVDPGWGGGAPVYPSHGLPGSPGHPSTGPIYGGGYPSQGLPGAPGHPSQGLPPGVEVWPQPPEGTTKPIDPSEGTSPEHPIVVPPPSEGTVILVWVSGVGYRYVTIGEAEPKDE